VGTTAQVLVEAQGRGRSEHFAPVTTPDALPAGSLANLAITASNGTTLSAEAA